MALKKKTQTNEKVINPETETAAEKEVAVEKEVEVAETAAEKEVAVEKEVEVAETAAEKEVAVEKETAAEAKPEKTQIAKTVSQSTAVASSSATGGVEAYVQQAAEQGFEDMDLGGFGTFPIIVLGTDGIFECDDDEWGNDAFIGQVQKTKAVYLVKQEGVQDSPCAYTYDKVNLNSPLDGATTVEDLETAWKEEGYDVEIKAYLEVLIEVVQEDHDYVGEFFIVKLPPSSANAFKGKHFIANSKFGVPLGSVCIEFGVGKKRTNGSNKYYPWTFKIVK